jgi:tetratricopeptide (TPR) repeat protein
MEEIRDANVKSLHRGLTRALLIETAGLAIISVMIIVMSVRLGSLVRQRDTFQRQISEAKNAAAVAKIGQLKAEQQLKDTQHNLTVSGQAMRIVASGLGCFNRGDLVGAMKYFDEALEIEPNNAYVWNLKGDVAFKAKDFPTAVRYFEQSIKDDPEYAYGYFDLARGYCANNQGVKADKAFGSAIKLWPKVRMFAAVDGQFRHLCFPLIAKYQLPTVPVSERHKWTVRENNRFPDPLLNQDVKQTKP